MRGACRRWLQNHGSVFTRRAEKAQHCHHHQQHQQQSYRASVWSLCLRGTCDMNNKCGVKTREKTQMHRWRRFYAGKEIARGPNQPVWSFWSINYRPYPGKHASLITSTHTQTHPLWMKSHFNREGDVKLVCMKLLSHSNFPFIRLLHLSNCTFWLIITLWLIGI